MMFRVSRLMTAVFAAWIFCSAALAAGMRVQPGGALIQGWPLGVRRELPMPLTVLNDDEQPHKVSVSACKASAIGGTVPRGYREIPDPAWLTFEPAELEVPAKGHALVKMFLTVPDEEKHRNAHWSVNLAVRSQPAEGQRIGLALYPRLEIETVFAQTTVAPEGDLSLTPSVLFLEDVVPGPAGAPQRVSLTAWNTTKKLQRCKARILVKPREGEKPLVALSQGLTWVPADSWVTVETPEFELAAEGSEQVPIRIALPADAGPSGAWEAILFIESDDGAQAFARLRVRTAKKP